ncbi:NUDIX hydrolase [Clostridium swellfunianum]|uniref:NUDIX hydrolase n=1 Tax=Clostridium swellfunianum TaxID=1367462 RepID=UPI00202DEAE8|nr:NUDIX hydrolase [Clostridium swellfunianum]MCM0649149.1 NUDIX hydrolase [Clostridium swellfunianum]
MKKQDLFELIEDYKPIDTNEIKSKKKILDFICKHDNFANRNNTSGHITGAAWVVNRDRSKVLLTHHIKLDMWLQIGGHVEGEEHVLETALREAREESGLTSLKLISNKVFDTDVHLFPQKGDFPAHFHYDIRFLFEADENEKINRQKEESKDMKWIALKDVPIYAKENTILRMTNKIK